MVEFGFNQKTGQLVSLADKGVEYVPCCSGMSCAFGNFFRKTAAGVVPSTQSL